MMSLDHVLSMLPDLTPDELEEVRRRVVALSSIGETDKDVDEDWLLFGIKEVLEARGLGQTVPPHFTVRNRRQFHGYMNKSEKVRQVLTKALPDMTKIERLKLARIMAECLADYLSNYRNVTLNTMLGNTDLMIQALDAAFPGYLSAGMVRVVLRGIPRAAG